MLHDMFDLLGLPLYNTGLSVFNVWLDDSKENDETEEDAEGDSYKSAPKCVINAAGRWRRKQRKMSARNHSKGLTDIRLKKTASSQSVIF